VKPKRGLIRRLIKYGLLELLAITGAVAYVILSVSLPSPGPELLAGSVIAFVGAALIWHFVQVIRDPVGAVREEDHPPY
jgi:hypothetical protein